MADSSPTADLADLIGRAAKFSYLAKRLGMDWRDEDCGMRSPSPWEEYREQFEELQSGLRELSGATAEPPAGFEKVARRLQSLARMAWLIEGRGTEGYQKYGEKLARCGWRTFAEASAAMEALRRARVEFHRRGGASWHLAEIYAEQEAPRLPSFAAEEKAGAPPRCDPPRSRRSPLSLGDDWNASDALAELGRRLTERVLRWNYPTAEEMDDKRPDYLELDERRRWFVFERPLDEVLSLVNFPCALTWFGLHAPQIGETVREKVEDLAARLPLRDGYGDTEEGLIVAISEVANDLNTIAAEMRGADQRRGEVEAFLSWLEKRGGEAPGEDIFPRHAASLNACRMTGIVLDDWILDEGSKSVRLIVRMKPPAKAALAEARRADENDAAGSSNSRGEKVGWTQEITIESKGGLPMRLLGGFPKGVNGAGGREDEAPAGQRDEGKAEPPRVILANEDRDKWLYGMCGKKRRGQLLTFPAIAAKLREIAPKKKWIIISDPKAIKNAANRWAERNGKPLIPRRQHGRRPQ